MGRGRAGLHRGFYIGEGVLEGGDEGLVLVDFDIKLQLGQVGVVVADLDFLLVPVGLHQSQRPFGSVLFLLEFSQVLVLLLIDFLQFVFTLDEGLFLHGE